MDYTKTDNEEARSLIQITGVNSNKYHVLQYSQINKPHTFSPQNKGSTYRINKT